MPYGQCSHGYILRLVLLEEWGYAPTTQNPVIDSTQAVKIAKIESIAQCTDDWLVWSTDQVDIVRMIAYVHLLCYML